MLIVDCWPCQVLVQDERNRQWFDYERQPAVYRRTTARANRFPESEVLCVDFCVHVLGWGILEGRLTIFFHVVLTRSMRNEQENKLDLEIYSPTPPQDRN